MKRVPKAGRPLAKCIHLNDCNCREVWAIMVPLAPGMGSITATATAQVVPWYLVYLG
jgi:hypothetical protein